ncbi:MAG TPA: hypothetical protein VKK06_12145, partial [Terriglobia bacterium]|nr:hypothetical protein [Terriglobia bacterium]
RRSQLPNPNGSISTVTGGGSTVAAYTRRRSQHEQQFATDTYGAMEKLPRYCLISAEQNVWFV